MTKSEFISLLLRWFSKALIINCPCDLLLTFKMGDHSVNSTAPRPTQRLHSFTKAEKMMQRQS